MNTDTITDAAKVTSSKIADAAKVTSSKIVDTAQDTSSAINDAFLTSAKFLKSVPQIDLDMALGWMGLQRRRSSSVGVSFGAGILLGAGLGMLFAPKSGRELRTAILDMLRDTPLKDAAQTAVKKAEDVMDDAKSAANDVASDVKSTAKDVAKDVKSMAHDVKHGAEKAGNGAKDVLADVKKKVDSNVRPS